MNMKNSLRGFKLKGSSALLLAVGSLLSAGTVQADTAAGVTLTNTVTVDYDDAGGTAQPQLTANVSVIVDHEPSVAWGTAPAGQTTSSGGTLPTAYTITLTNTGNGADSYTIADNTPPTGTCGLGTLGAEAFAFTTPIPLGGTTASAGSAIGATTITTPDDTNTADSIVRGIANGETIVIGADTVTVTGISENNAGSGNTVITFTPALTVAVAIGDQAGEQVSFSYGATGAAGTVSSGATGCTHAHELVATGSTETGGNTAGTATVNGWSTTVEGATLTVAKYVRNVSNAAKNTGAADITYTGAGAGVTYRTSGKVTGNPGDILEYAVQINNPGAGLATDVTFQDTLPQFTSIDIDTGTGGTQAAIAIDQTSDATLDIAVDDTGVYTATNETETIAVTTGIVAQSGQALRVFPGADATVTTASEAGTNAAATSGGTGGGVPGGATVTILYRVIIE